ncbi:MAG: glycerate kinase, partial [Planctomycetota bacterium]
MALRVVVAPNAFKGSQSAVEAAAAMEEGVLAAEPGASVVRVPVADGGDGLVDVLVEALGGELRSASVSGPLGDPVEASFGWIPAKSTAVVEMALASGLALLERDQLNPALTTTLGTGELIAAALDLGANHLILGLGGSAPNDGGVGMAQALGVQFLDASGKPVRPCGGELAMINRIDLSGPRREIGGCSV